MAKSATKDGARKKSSSKELARRSSGNEKGRRSEERSEGNDSSNTAADALLKLLESPLVADLLAVGATAALAALAEHRYSSRSGEGAGAKRALKGAVTAAAAAMGRRIATEFDEIKKAAKAKAAEPAE